MYDSKTEFEAIIKDIWFSGRPNVFGGIWLDEVMQLSGISPDWTVQNGQGIRAVHRTLPEGHLYWVNSPALAN